ncbi:MAG TPA: PaaI family thioesterase [Caulobacter sp.]|nr:PaaI family thioesterase [Caulobacter sp.]
MSETQRRFGRIAPEEIEGLSGLELLERVIDGRLNQLPIGQTLDFAIVAAERGRVVVEGRPSEGHVNLIGTIHAGWTATLLDTAMACAVLSTLGPDQTFTTMEFKLTLLKPVTAGMGTLRGIGTILQAGRRAGFAEARLVDEADRPLAHATTTCIVLPKG